MGLADNNVVANNAAIANVAIAVQGALDNMLKTVIALAVSLVSSALAVIFGLLKTIKTAITNAIRAVIRSIVSFFVGLFGGGKTCVPTTPIYTHEPARDQMDPAGGPGATFNDGVGTKVEACLKAPRQSGGTFSSYPDWWPALPAPTTDFRRGHLLANSMGGPAEWWNLAPIYFLVNNSAMATCENRIRSAVDCGHTVKLTVEAVFTDPADLKPDQIIMTATSDLGMDMNATIQNVPAPGPGVPATCVNGGQNTFTC